MIYIQFNHYFTHMSMYLNPKHSGGLNSPISSRSSSLMHSQLSVDIVRCLGARLTSTLLGSLLGNFCSLLDLAWSLLLDVLSLLGDGAFCIRSNSTSVLKRTEAADILAGLSSISSFDFGVLSFLQMLKSRERSLRELTDLPLEFFRVVLRKKEENIVF